MNFWDSWIKPFIGRIIAAFVAGTLVPLVSHIGVVLTPEHIEVITGFGLTLAFIVYSVIHKLINKWINPGDAASGHLIVEQQAVTTELKAADRNR